MTAVRRGEKIRVRIKERCPRRLVLAVSAVEVLRASSSDALRMTASRFASVIAPLIVPRLEPCSHKESGRLLDDERGPPGSRQDAGATSCVRLAKAQ